MKVIVLAGIIAIVVAIPFGLGPKDIPNHPDCPDVPPGPEEFPTFLSHPDECDSYYECDSGGNAIYMTCPPGLHWNQFNVTCDWPRNVDCSKPN